MILFSTKLPVGADLREATEATWFLADMPLQHCMETQIGVVVLYSTLHRHHTIQSPWQSVLQCARKDLQLNVEH